MIFYVLLLLIVLSLFFISYKYPSKEKIISLLILSVLVVIGGFRDRIGWDYGSYTNWYLMGNRDEGFEFGFLVIMKFFRYLSLDYRFLFFFFSFFTYFFLYLGVRKYTEKTSLPLVIYFLIPVLFLYSFTYIRQCLSVAIAFYAFAFLLDKKYLAYALWMFVGVSFHYSCLIPFIVFLAIYAYGDFVKSNHLYFLIGISFLISQVGIIHWLSLLLKNSHYFFYVSSKFAAPVPLLKLLIINIMSFIIIYFFQKNGFEKNNQRYLLLLYVCSTLFLNLFSESIELTRIYIYFRIFEIILIADIISYALTNKRIVLIGFICCFYFLPYFRAIKIDSESKDNDFKLIPYKSLLLKSD